MCYKLIKKEIIFLIVLVVIAGGIFIFSVNQQKNKSTSVHSLSPVSSLFDPLNAMYMIDGQLVTLVNGKATMSAAPGSAEQVTTSVFGQLVRGDINGDGNADAALILVQNSGGSGTFYFVAAAINTTSGAQGTNAILLGDRIAPQNVEIQNGEILANYADRKLSEPMTAIPSVGVTKYLKYNGSALIDVSH